MRKIIILCSVALSLVLTTACGNFIETSDNGKLDGYWQLYAIDSLATGGTVDYTATHTFWAVEGRILQTSSALGGQIIFRFAHEGDSLRLWDARVNDRDHDDPPVTDPLLLAPMGINQLEESFHIDALSSSRLTLSTPQLRLHFRKF